VANVSKINSKRLVRNLDQGDYIVTLKTPEKGQALILITLKIRSLLMKYSRAVVIRLILTTMPNSNGNPLSSGN
jgi:hypothetical protein